MLEPGVVRHTKMTSLLEHSDQTGAKGGLKSLVVEQWQNNVSHSLFITVVMFFARSIDCSRKKRS